MTTLYERARGRWEEVYIHRFGIDQRVLNGKHHPCPGCGGKDRFRLVKGRDGDVFCSGTYMRPMQFLQHVTGMDFAALAPMVEEIVGKEDAPTTKPESTGERLYRVSRPLRASRYLRSRGIAEAPCGLRCIASLPYYDGMDEVGRFPAIIAPLTRQDGKVVSVQAIYLDGGKKANVPVPKKTFTGSGTVSGCAVRLGKWKPRDVLGVAEGVETALSAAKLFGHVVWATLSTSGMASFQWPASLKKAVIYADNDASYAGHAAAWKLAHRMAKAGVEVEVKLPPDVGTDWNDVLRSGK